MLELKQEKRFWDIETCSCVLHFKITGKTLHMHCSMCRKSELQQLLTLDKMNNKLKLCIYMRQFTGSKL